jgi:hypothetical protein
MSRSKPKAIREFCPKEEDEQAAVVGWAVSMEGREPRLRLLHASMNGILTNPRFGAKLQRLGRKAGVPDLFLPVRIFAKYPIERWQSGLWIEMKRLKGGVVSDEQKAWHIALREQGYRVEVCRGAEAAIAALKDYLEI